MANVKIISIFIIVSSCATGIIAQESVQQAWIKHYQSGLESNFDYAVGIALDNDGRRQ